MGKREAEESESGMLLQKEAMKLSPIIGSEDSEPQNAGSL